MNKNSLKLYIPFWITVVILLLYINLFNNFTILFWGVFLCERIFNAIYIDRALKKIDVIIEEGGFNVKLFGIIIFTVCLGIGILFWILLNQRQLFYIIIMGEIFDFIIMKMFKVKK